MKIKVVIWSMLSVLFVACGGGQNLESKNGFAVLRAPKPGEKVANFAGGCFWAMHECMIELKGVNTVLSGYAGGTKANPTYEEVLTKKTGHAESVQVYYDPAIISFEQLTEAFFHSHDPTQTDGQGPDRGSDYRSVAFYRSVEERAIIFSLMDKIDAGGRYDNPVATEVAPFSVFYPAEIAHQDYYQLNKFDPYIRNVSKAKVMKLRKTLPDLIKKEYVD